MLNDKLTLKDNKIGKAFNTVKKAVLTAVIPIAFSGCMYMHQSIDPTIDGFQISDGYVITAKDDTPGLYNIDVTIADTFTYMDIPCNGQKEVSHLLTNDVIEDLIPDDFPGKSVTLDFLVTDEDHDTASFSDTYVRNDSYLSNKN